MTNESGKTRWLLAGQQLLRRFGVRGVKLEGLVDTSGLTTGSFYHHFANMEEYRNELAGFYGWTQIENTLSALHDSEPRQRLSALMQLARDDAMDSLDGAMRDWAGSDPIAAEAVRALDATLLEHLAEAFQAMGHDETGARVRAVLLFSAGVARVHLPWTLDDSSETLLDILGPTD